MPSVAPGVVAAFCTRVPDRGGRREPTALRIRKPIPIIEFGVSRAFGRRRQPNGRTPPTRPRRARRIGEWVVTEAAAWTCPNCHQDVTTAFCPNCGETAVDPRDLSLRALARQAF